MKKLINLALVMLVALSTVGCYSDFSEPHVESFYTDKNFADATIISVRELKERYSTIPMGGNAEVEENLVVRGKVISSDRDGNVYKSLYILDHSDPKGSAAIELRLYASNYVEYPVGTMVYVRLKGLVIGDYRGMLSIGAKSADPSYANTNIQERLLLKAHIFRGSRVPMDFRDTVVVNKDNYKTALNDDMLGRLVRFEGVESSYGTSAWGYENTFPNYFAGADDSFEWNMSLAEVDSVFAYPPLAYYGQNPTIAQTSNTMVRYFGSSWYSYDRAGTDNKVGQYVVRCSGYARFRERAIPDNGALVDLTAIYTVFKNASNNDELKAYQLVVNYGTDIKVVD